MKRIWKYVIDKPVTVHEIPWHSRVLDVETQNGNPCVWFEVEDTYVKTKVGFHAVPTGGSPVGENFLGTAHNVDDAGLVFHIYAVGMDW